MIGFLLGRIAAGVVILFLVSLVAFALAPLAAAEDPALAAAGAGAEGLKASSEEIQASRTRLGLDRPFVVRYLEWLGNASKGNFGASLFREQPVTDAIATALPVTLSLAVVALAWALLIGLPAGIIGAVWPESTPSKIIVGASAIGIAMPTFVVGLVLIRAFAIDWSWFPAIGYRPLAAGFKSWFASIFLPSLSLGIPAAAALSRYVRVSMLEILTRDYIRTARGKGLLPHTIVWKHALRNAMIPIITVIALEIRILLGGAVAVEFVFALPGIGTLTVTAIVQGDYPILLGSVVLFAVIVILINTMVDVSYAFLNPKVRAS